MGVIKFQNWLRLTFPHLHANDINTVSAGGNVGDFFIDLNAVIHDAINDVYETDDPDELEKMFQMSAAYWTSPDGIHDTLMNKLFEFIMIVKPTGTLYLAADGTVLKAKLMQQRQRSFKSGANSQPFNRNQVKPGTDFMMTICARVRQSLKTWAAEGLRSGEYRPARIELSDTTIEGEGEHKIMKILHSGGRKKGFIDVIYSPDSDIHFLTYLLGVQIRPIIIMRRKHTVELDGPKFEFFHATKTRDQIITKLGFGSIKDFVLVCMFGGNDFIPALPFSKFGYGNGFDAIVKAYKKSFGHQIGSALFVNEKVNWRALANYLAALEVQSVKFLQRAAVDELKNPDKYYNEETGEDRRSPVLKYSLMGSGDDIEFNPVLFNSRYKSYIFGTFHEPDMAREEFNFDATEEQVKNYLEGIVWVLSYYVTQESNVNEDWCYTFHYPPDVSDVRKYILKHANKPTWTKFPLLTERTEDGTKKIPPNSPLEHMITILKRDELWMVPPIVSTLFLQEIPDLFPESVFVDNTSVSFGTEGEDIVLVNFPSMAQIRRTFDIIRDDPSVVRVNKIRRNPTVIWPMKQGGKKK